MLEVPAIHKRPPRVRLTTVFRKLLALQDVIASAVKESRADALAIVVDVRARARRPRCSRCGALGDGAHDSKMRTWRHLDLGPWVCSFAGDSDGSRVVGAIRSSPSGSWAVGSLFTRDFEDLTAFFAQQTSKTVVSRVMKIAWPTVGTIIERAVRRHGLPLARRRLYHIGIDEISYRKHHKYLTLVADHVSGEIVWGGEGRSGATVGKFLDELGPQAAAGIDLVSMDMSQAFISKVRERLPHATIVFDPFHVVKLANDAVDQVRRRQVRVLHPDDAVHVKRTRWVLLKAPENLLPHETEKLAGDLRREPASLPRLPAQGGAARAVPPDAGARGHSPRRLARLYATLLDEGEYLCSERTMYRVLAAAGEVHERRDQLVHPAYPKPELLATAPNQVWSWDITKLLGRRSGRTSTCT